MHYNSEGAARRFWLCEFPTPVKNGSMLKSASRSRTLASILLILAFALLGACKEKAIVTATSGLLMRDRPALDGKQLDLLPAGSEVEILEEGPMQVIDGTTAHWKRVKHNQTEGWVYGGYLVDSGNDGTVKQIRDCISSEGYWHSQEEICYAPQLRKLTQKGSFSGLCGMERYSLFPDGRVWVSGVYVQEPGFAGTWKYEGGDAIRVNLNHGVSYRARLGSGGMQYEIFGEDTGWDLYPLNGGQGCP